MQEPQVFKTPEGGSVYGLATGTAAVGQDADPEAIDNRLHPCFRAGMLTQQMNRGYPEVPIVDDGVVPACQQREPWGWSRRTHSAITRFWPSSQAVKEVLDS